VLSAQDLELKIKPYVMKDGTVVINAWCDSDYAGDKDSRKSVTGFLVFINGALVSWKSRLQKTVGLSSAECEYYAMTEVAQELLYIKQVLEFLKVECSFQ